MNEIEPIRNFQPNVAAPTPENGPTLWYRRFGADRIRRDSVLNSRAGGRRTGAPDPSHPEHIHLHR